MATNQTVQANQATATPTPTFERRPINWELFKSKISNIRPYDGDTNTLSKFIYLCDNLIITYRAYNDQELNDHIFECIQGKLIGKAELMVGNRVELNNWALLKAALIQCFSDKRNLQSLTQELTRTRPQRNENLIEFGNRLQLLVSNIVQRISNDTNLDVNQKAVFIQFCENTALNTFIKGCTGTLKNNMHLKAPASLEGRT
ncbi:uncharacterized protein [Diabrotica undecimpunctata]|uniref:uncharacterized protein n=1 Tax=Diabrotica undecimpunctata TaxID=50387 RepID=UPI003B633D0A